ncbi:MAG TPA: hypothetical protein VF746_03485 [Longimicrobium sp.]|jgi:hypothetical protein
MDRKTVVEMIRNNPELVEQGRERMEGVLTRSATDPEFRTQLLTEPRAALSSHFGHEVPEGIVFIENKATATIVLPDFVDPSAELSESELEAVAGGSEIITAIAVGVAIGSALTVIGYELTH